MLHLKWYVHRYNNEIVCSVVVVDPDFWKVAARKISAVLSSDLDAMKDYLDSVREVDAGLDVAYSRKRPAVSLPSLARAANIPRRSHGNLNDSSETLPKVASDVEDALHQLNNIDTSVIEYTPEV